MRRTFAHYSKVPPAEWPWHHFSPREIACKGTGKLTIDTEAMDMLQRLRTNLGKPLILTSAYRSPEHNRKVGGAKASKHMEGVAFDVRMDNHDPHTFEAAARAAGFSGFGYYPKSGFMHIDTAEPRSWGTPWPLTATAWPTEPPRQPEKTVRGQRRQGRRRGRRGRCRGRRCRVPAHIGQSCANGAACGCLCGRCVHWVYAVAAVALIRRWASAIIAALVLLGAALLYRKGRQDADDANTAQDFNEYVAARRRMDDG